MKQRIMLLVSLAICLFATTAFGQSDSTESAGGGMPPMGPTPQIKAMDYLVGTWSADFNVRMAPTAVWTTSPATHVVESIWDGCALRINFASSVMGMPFNGQATVTYDRNSNKWQMVWIDNFGANQNLLEGDKVGNVMTLRGEGVEMGQAFMMKDITTYKSDTEFDWQMDISFDDGKNWFTQMKATYKKAE